MIEAIRGTPVLAYNRGSVPEIIDPASPASSWKTRPARLPWSTVLPRWTGPPSASSSKPASPRAAWRWIIFAAYRGLMEQAEPRIKLVSSAE